MSSPTPTRARRSIEAGFLAGVSGSESGEGVLAGRGGKGGRGDMEGDWRPK